MSTRPNTAPNATVSSLVSPSPAPDATTGGPGPATFGRGAGHFRNLNRTLGPTRPFLSFTPCSGHGVNDTTPSQKPLCRGMPSFNFRMAVRDTSGGSGQCSPHTVNHHSCNLPDRVQTPYTLAANPPRTRTMNILGIRGAGNGVLSGNPCRQYRKSRFWAF